MIFNLRSQPTTNVQTLLISVAVCCLPFTHFSLFIFLTPSSLTFHSSSSSLLPHSLFTLHLPHSFFFISFSSLTFYSSSSLLHSLFTLHLPHSFFIHFSFFSFFFTPSSFLLHSPLILFSRSLRSFIWRSILTFKLYFKHYTFECSYSIVNNNHNSRDFLRRPVDIFYIIVAFVSMIFITYSRYILSCSLDGYVRLMS